MTALAISRYQDSWMRAFDAADLHVYQRQAANLLGVAAARGSEGQEVLHALEYWRAVSLLDSRVAELTRHAS